MIPELSFLLDLILPASQILEKCKYVMISQKSLTFRSGGWVGGFRGQGDGGGSGGAKVGRRGGEADLL